MESVFGDCEASETVSDFVGDQIVVISEESVRERKDMA